LFGFWVRGAAVAALFVFPQFEKNKSPFDLNFKKGFY